MDEVKLPPGFHTSIWAEGMPNARSMAVGSKGTVFVGSRLVGNVYAVVDKGDRREVKIIAKGLHSAQRRGFKAHTRADIDGSMREAAQPLSEEEIETLAHYIAHLPSTP